MSDKNTPRKASELDDASDRGDLSQDGFGDHDREFHPADTTSDTDNPPGNEPRPGRRRDDRSSRQGHRVEVHFRIMTIRNRGHGFDYRALPR